MLSQRGRSRNNGGVSVATIGSEVSVVVSVELIGIADVRGSVSRELHRATKHSVGCSGAGAVAANEGTVTGGSVAQPIQVGTSRSAVDVIIDETAAIITSIVWNDIELY